MRIVQIIDSLDSGGAEKMAVNYANALASHIAFSGLITTRKEGVLKKQLDSKVHYLFLNRKKVLDFSAILKLRAYCKTNHIEYLQPHSSSFFVAVVLKIMLPKTKIIWHDHNGLSEFLTNRKTIALKLASLFFNGIVVVNDRLKQWAANSLYCKNIIYLPNFTETQIDEVPCTKLFGNANKRILCLANLRQQKNHFLLLKVAKKINKTYPDWTFHLVGKDFKDSYSHQLKEEIKNCNLENKVYIYDSKEDINAIINQCEIAILTSNSEGLPVALLEYGWNKKAVVVTAVGEIPLIVEHQKNGCIVPVNNLELFYESLVTLIENESLRGIYGNALYETMLNKHAKNSIINQYLTWIKTNEL